MPQAKTILHLVYRFDIGGLETVLVNLINSLPEQSFKHIIVSLTNANQDFIKNLQQKVEIIELCKPPGNSIRIYRQLWELFQHYKPDIVHSYNIATLEYQLIAALAGVKRRVHAEHGRDIFDLDGSNRKYQLLRRLINPVVHYWIPVSNELCQWLINTVKIPAKKVKLIYNGIDSKKYCPGDKRKIDVFTVITIGRLAPVKDQLTLIKAIELIATQYPERKKRIKLRIIGDGELKAELAAYIAEKQLEALVCLPGASYQVAAELQLADLFVLTSLAEGIALTALEAMATSLPVIATNVGGNPEIIESGVNGQLVAVKAIEEIANAVMSYMDDRQLGQTHGAAGRQKIEKNFSLEIMANNYLNIYSQ